MPPIGLKRKAQTPLSDDNDDSTDSENKEAMEIEPEADENWDNDNKIVQIPINTKPIIGFHLMPTCLPEPKPAEEKQPLLNESLKESLLQHFKLSWNENKPFQNEHFEIISHPFKLCIINELLQDSSILKDVRCEFYELDWNKRKLDLYNFHQSLDLQHISLKNIKSVYNFLKNDVMRLVAELMNVELTHISATCSFYSDTDYLLVHDDQREDRVVAFVLYISDVYEWKDSWGGALQLLDHNENYQPNCVNREIYPKNNQLVLFPVSPISYHQVDEVRIKNFCRYSINGWFHGKIKPPEITPICQKIQNGKISDAIVSDVDLNEFINPTYLDQDNIKDIQEQIEASSEISLLNYFNEDFYEEVNDALNRDELKWKLVGPPNRSHYEILEEGALPESLQKLLEILKSEITFTLLKSYTELELQPEVRYEVQRWSAGCYNLLHDFELSGEPELDVILQFGCENIIGGQIQYIDEKEEVQTALITLGHNNNTMNLVYRDSGRINHYVSKYTRKPYYVVMCSYSENKRK